MSLAENQVSSLDVLDVFVLIFRMKLVGCPDQLDRHLQKIFHPFIICIPSHTSTNRNLTTH